MDIDEQLLSKNEEAKAGEFRASKRAQESENIAQEGASFREQVKAKKGLNITTEERAKELIFRDSPIRQLTDGFLKFSWENLITSWGLTLLYINLHAFLNKVFGPQVFRTLGEEWVPASIRKLGEGKTKQVASLLRIIEGAGLSCLDLGCFFLVILVTTFIVIIASILSGDLEVIWALFKTALGVLKDLFS